MEAEEERMTNFRFLALFAALALLFMVSTTVLAQAPKRPHTFTGTVMVDYAMAMEGTEVTAMIDGETVGMTMVMDGRYTIQVDPGDPAAEGYMDFSGKTVMFMVGMVYAEQSAMWMEGMVSFLNLMVMAMEPEPTMEPVLDVLLSGLTARPQVRLNSPVPVTATFSEPVSGFTLDDISVVNGTASNFAGSGAVYTFDVTPDDIGEVTVAIAAGVAEDSDGNSNEAAPRFSLGITYDDDGDGGISKNEAIAAVVDYFAGRITKAETIAVIVLYFSAPTEPEPSENCIQAVSTDGTVNGQWASGCDSEERAGSHARYYTFTLDASSEVTVTLESSAADTHLYLRQGDATSGTALHENDDYEGIASSQIVATLDAGAYTIEATTDTAGATGSFTLTVSRSDAPTTPPVTTEPHEVAERAALAALYNATGGSDWQNNSGWLSNAPVGDWFGVTTYSDTDEYSARRVEAVRLKDNGLAGALPPELGELRRLRVLDLGAASYTCTDSVCQPDSDNGNQLTGPIPSEWIGLNRLRIFDLAANPVTGPVPDWLRWPYDLEHLDISGTQLTGGIPANLGNAPQLQHLDLSNNALTGSVPTRLGNLGNLRLLALDNNQLTGPVPLELADLDNLTTLRLSGNQLSGCVPVGLKDVATNDLPSLGLDDCPVDTSDPVDRAALVALYESTGGPNWTDNTGWLSGAPVKDWEGVTTDDNGRVMHILLPSHNLSGTLPLDIGLLTKLKTLQLYGNSLTGELPPTMGRLTELEVISLGGNAFTACIPGGLANLAPRGLFSIGLEPCPRTPLRSGGSVESDRAALVAFYHATDGDNWANNEGWLTDAPLNDWYGVNAFSQERVNTIRLIDNGLNGHLPPELGDLVWLSTIELGSYNWRCRGNSCTPSSPTGNRLTGPIPEEWRKLTWLSVIDLTANPVTGEIPAWLGEFPNMGWIMLGGTQMTGAIPDAWARLALQNLSLGWNNLEGPLPAWLGTMTELTHLNLWFNDLTGTLPVALSRLTALEDLSLGHNGFTGRIPEELGRLTALRALHLSNNDLTGSIPEELGNLTNLDTLGLANNDLSGCVPAALQSIERNDFDDLGLPFCGP